jgi:hypothetical protein
LVTTNFTANYGAQYQNKHSDCGWLHLHYLCDNLNIDWRSGPVMSQNASTHLNQLIRSSGEDTLLYKAALQSMNLPAAEPDVVTDYGNGAGFVSVDKDVYRDSQCRGHGPAINGEQDNDWDLQYCEGRVKQTHCLSNSCSGSANIHQVFPYLGPMETPGSAKHTAPPLDGLREKRGAETLCVSAFPL